MKSKDIRDQRARAINLEESKQIHWQLDRWIDRQMHAWIKWQINRGHMTKWSGWKASRRESEKLIRCKVEGETRDGDEYLTQVDRQIDDM